MSVNPFPFNHTRDFAATAPLELGAAGRVVNSAQGVRRIGEEDGRESRRQGEDRGKPREEREHDAQRQALAKLILGAFDVIVDDQAPPSNEPGLSASGRAEPDQPQSVIRNPRLEEAILEFMYALFHALDQIDDAEPTVEFVTRPMGIGPGSGRTGRNAFGERLDLLARRVALPPADVTPPAVDAMAGFEGIDPRLARSYADVLRLIHGDARTERSSTAPRMQLAALLLRLANAIHVAPTLGYGTPSAAGAMLRVRA